jgi:A/G-specific adenine glycosylase
VSGRNTSRAGRRRRLLDWYDRHRRDLPWRAGTGAAADSYGVWLSEIMLQQTTVATVGPYFSDFMRRWPDVHALAAASLDDVLVAWQGLGYYARARNLHRCARMVSRDRGGNFPEDEGALRALAGIGPYTAAAIAAIAFDAPANVVDGNVERVMARLFGVETPLPKAKAELAARAATLIAPDRPGDYAQALMDLGATVCTPKAPACGRCPWQNGCVALEAGDAGRLPRRTPRPLRPLRKGVAFWTLREDGHVLLRRRAEKGLLGGMMEFPSSEWRAADWPPAAARRAAPVAAAWRELPGVVEHGFTHFRLELTVMAATIDGGAGAGIKGCVWCAIDRLGTQALPTVMKKVARHALASAKS